METPPALQRLWSRRMTVTAPLPEEPDLGILEELFTPAQVGTDHNALRYVAEGSSLRFCGFQS